MKIALLVVALALHAWGATTVTQTIKNADGTNANGSVYITLTASCVSGGNLINTTPIMVTVIDGAFSVSLTENDTCVPSGTSYSVRYAMRGATPRQEYWTVPTSGSPVTIGDVRTASIPTPALSIAISQITGYGAKGGLLASTGSAWSRLAVGTNNYVLTADSAEATGIKWAALGNAPTATALAANGANCSAGQSPLGVDASGAAEGCFDVGTQTEVDAHTNSTAAHGATGANVGTTNTQELTNKTLTTPIIGAYTVAGLPAAGSANRVAIVTDAATAGSCTSGGGSARAWCRDTGSAWESLGDGGSGGGSGTVNSGTEGEVTYYAATGTAVSGLPRMVWDSASGEIRWKNSGGTVKAKMDTATGLLTEGIAETGGLTRTLGNAGDTAASSFTIRGGDAASNAEPGFFSAWSSDPSSPFRSFLFPCGSAGNWCMTGSTPAADSTDHILSAANTKTVQNKTLDNTNAFSGYTDWTQIAAPGAPASGKVRVYAKTGAELCWKDSAGTETCGGSGGGLADPGGNGIVVRTALDTTTNRTLTGTSDQIDVANGDGTGGNPTISLATNAKRGTVQFVLDGGGSAVTTGAKGWIRVPYAGTITGVEVTADQTGSIVVDLWKDTYANFPPTVADTITASAKPTLSSAQKSQDNTLTGWTTSIAAGDYIRLNVDSAATVTYVVVSLQVTRN